MNDQNYLHIALIYLVIINVVTFFMFGIDKWKAKKSKWRIRETALLGLAVLGGSVGAWLGMKVWHHKTLHKKFKKAIPTTEPELTIKAKVTKQVRNLVYINAEITNSKGELCNEGEAIYYLMNQEKAKEMGFQHCDVEE